jgi:hypothetical protein
VIPTSIRTYGDKVGFMEKELDAEIIEQIILKD